MPLGPSLSTLLLEIAGCFLDLWLHRIFLQRAKLSKKHCAKAGSAKVDPPLHVAAKLGHPVLASLRCGDDIWLITRTAHASDVWALFKDLYRDCGLVLNLDDSGSVIIAGGPPKDSTALEDLQRRPCWSLLQLTPQCTWKVADWRLAPRVNRALEEVRAHGLTMLHRIRIFNRHVDALMRQGGFHEELLDGLDPLHQCISSLYLKAIESGTESYLPSPSLFSEKTGTASPAMAAKSYGELLSALLWWPRKSGGLGARHLAMALHDGQDWLVPLLKLGPQKSLEAAVQSATRSSFSRNDHYDSHLRTLLGPLIQDLFGTATLLDSRYTALLE